MNPAETAPAPADSPAAPAAVAATATTAPLRPLWRAVGLLRPLPFLLAAFGWLRLDRETPAEVTALVDRSAAVVAALAPSGLIASAEDVRWVDPLPGTLGSRFRSVRALVRAARAGEPADVFLVDATLSPEGRVLRLGAVRNLSDTSAADERDLIVSEGRAAWSLGDDDRSGLRLLYLDRGPALVGPEWTLVKRLQQHLTQLEETGRFGGLDQRAFRLGKGAKRLALAFDRDALHVDADGRVSRVRTALSAGQDGDPLEEQGAEVPVPGNLVTWAVDRARALPWFGNDNMQLVKAVAFAGLDKVEQMVANVTGDEGAAQVAEELAASGPAKPVRFTDPETGWPPAPMAPMLPNPLPEEGQWRLIEKDPFVRQNPGAPSAFATAFIRTDKERRYSRIYVTLWDPRQVELRTMSGVVEPKTATGETGPGLVPREPKVMERLVGTLNGGFQALHGEFGMMANGVVYLPPKPYGATVARLKDGSTVFGTWPEDPTVPADVIDFRQNMTPLVMDGQVNPYGRTWWGGVPPGWTDESRTVRSGICLTKEGFVAYFYGISIDAMHLAAAMQQARCNYGIHLDMNAGHTGLEFYRVSKTEELPKLDRVLEKSWEATGEVDGLPGYSFLGRRLIKFMGLMNFPRYIRREGRDFFYLLLKPVLPPEPLKPLLASAKEGEGVWTVKGLPQHGWPYALATNELRADEQTTVRVLALDPARVEPGEDGSQTVLTVPTLNAPAQAVWLFEHRFVFGKAPAPTAVPLLPLGARAARAEQAFALDAHERLLLAECHGGCATEALEKVLRAAGAAEPFGYLEKAAPVAIGGVRLLNGDAPRAGKALRLVRSAAAPGRRFFEKTPVVGIKQWYPLQSKRIRYFRKPKAATPENE